MYVEGVEGIVVFQCVFEIGGGEEIDYFGGQVDYQCVYWIGGVGGWGDGYQIGDYVGCDVQGVWFVVGDLFGEYLGQGCGGGGDLGYQYGYFGGVVGGGGGIGVEIELVDLQYGCFDQGVVEVVWGYWCGWVVFVFVQYQVGDQIGDIGVDVYYGVVGEVQYVLVLYQGVVIVLDYVCDWCVDYGELDCYEDQYC